MNKNVFLLWQGQFVSQLGMHAYTIAMMFWLMENTGSSALMSVIFIVSVLPSVLFGPFAGVIADQCSRKNIIVAMDMVRGLSVLSLAIVLYVGIAGIEVIVTMFILVSAINGLAKAFFQPAADALIPDLVSREKLTKTLAFFQSSTQLTTIIGQAIGGMMYRMLGAPLMLLANAFSYLLSALSECFIQQHQADSFRNLSGRQTYQQHKAHLVEGWRHVASRPGMVPTMFFTALINFFVAPIMLLLPFYVVDQLGEGAHWYGFLLAFMASGSMAGFGISAGVRITSERRTYSMLLSMFLFSTSLLFFSQASSTFISSATIFVSGLCLGVFNLQAMTLFQHSAPTQIRGRVMSLLMTISSLALPTGLLVGGVLGTLTDNNTRLVFGVCSICIFVLTVVASFSSEIRRYLGYQEDTSAVQAQ